MQTRTPTRTRLAIAAALGLAGSAANASLVLEGPENFQGTGLGSVNTILTIQSPGNATFEQGSVGRTTGSSTDVRTGDFQPGASQTQTRTLGELGVTSASSLRVVFNALEPGGTANGITLSNLVLNIYSPTGATLFSSGAFTPVTFADTFTGAGNSGFVFALDGQQAQAAQAAAFTGATFGSNIVGLSAAAGQGGAAPAGSAATGGFETFFVANSPTTVAAIPEPETYALMMAGLGIVGFAARRRKAR